jgi:hypothetical protein
VAVVGHLFTFTVPPSAFGDPDTDEELTLTVGALPVWLSFNAATATFSGTPLAAHLGLANITFTVTDRDGRATPVSFALRVVTALDPNSFGGPGLAYPDWISRYLSQRMLAGGDPEESSAWGLGGDPDGDGRSNLEEYAFASNPLSPHDGAPLVIGRATDGALWIGYRRRAGDSRLEFVLETSTDLLRWSEATAELEPSGPTRIDDQSEWVTFRIGQGDLAVPSFFRVRASYGP